MRSIFITGAASGIGRETARLFAERGWRVGLYDLDEAGVRAAADEIGGETVAGSLDVRDYEAYRTAVERFGEAAGGRLDVLFNCAGVMRMGPFGELSPADHRLTVEVNALGVLNGIHAALDLLRATPDAHVVSMGSSSGVYGVPDLATYSASKFFVRGLTEALNLELAADDIVVTDLMPLYVDTPMISGQSYRSGTLETFGARLTARQIAERVWKAAHSRRVHHRPGLLNKLLAYASGALPFVNRPTMKLLDRRR